MGNPIFEPSPEQDEHSSSYHCRHDRPSRRRLDLARNPFRIPPNISPSDRRRAQVTRTSYRGDTFTVRGMSANQLWGPEEDIPDLVSDDSEDEEALVARPPRPPRPDAEALLTLGRLQRLTAEAGEWARDYRARQRAAAANQSYTQQQPQPESLRTVAETQSDAPVAALAAYSQSESWLMLRQELVRTVASRQMQLVGLPHNIQRVRRVSREVLQELDERVQRMNEEHRRDARRRAEELVRPLLAPDFFSQ
ncbi:hypothetical protein ABBQ32_004138 [Trebouxia sp. C0010 RCD-2024]